MYVDLPEIQRCCCCVPARHGLLIWIYIKLMLSIITLVPVIILTILFPYFSTAERCVIGGVALPGLVVDIVMNIMALVGGHSKNAKLLKAYYSYSVFSLILFITIYIGVSILNLYVVGFFRDYHPFVWHYVLWYTTVGFASVVLQVYMLLLLRSKVHVLARNCQFRFMNNAAEAEVQCAMVVDKTNWSYPNNPLEELEDKREQENTQNNNSSHVGQEIPD